MNVRPASPCSGRTTRGPVNGIYFFNREEEIYAVNPTEKYRCIDVVSACYLRQWGGNKPKRDVANRQRDRKKNKRRAKHNRQWGYV